MTLNLALKTTLADSSLDAPRDKAPANAASASTPAHSAMRAQGKLTVRPAQWKDKTALLDMVHALAHNHGDAATLDVTTLVDLLKSEMPWMRLWVADVDGKAVGYAGLTGGMRLHFGQRTMDLHHLFVQPEHRGTGIGRALIDAAIQCAREHGCVRLTVGTQETNTKAQAAYVACGFTPVPMTGKRFSMEVA